MTTDNQFHQRKRINKWAIIGFVGGLLCVFFAWVGIVPLLTITFSGIGIYYVVKRKARGKWFAIVGLILGIIYFIVYLNLYGHLTYFYDSAPKFYRSYPQIAKNIIDSFTEKDVEILEKQLKECEQKSVIYGCGVLFDYINNPKYKSSDYSIFQYNKFLREYKNKLYVALQNCLERKDLIERRKVADAEERKELIDRYKESLQVLLKEEYNKRKQEIGYRAPSVEELLLELKFDLNYNNGCTTEELKNLLIKNVGN